MNCLLKYGYFLLLAFLGTSCASNYHFINPPSLELTNSPEKLDNGRVEIGARYHVLKDAGNRRYAQNEMKSRVSLLAVRIENNSTDTLYLPNNIYVEAQKTPLYMLRKEEAYEAIRQDIVERSSGKGRPFGEWVFHLPRAISNGIFQTKANMRFLEELDEFYLLPCYIAPGMSIVGLLVLEVNQDTPLRFVLDK